MKGSLAIPGGEGNGSTHGICDLDKLFLDEWLELGRQRFSMFLQGLDEQIRKWRPRALHIVRRRAVWYRTCLGVVKIVRTCYRDGRGVYRYLLDEVLGMARRCHATVVVRGRALELAVQMTFRRAATVLAKMTPVTLAHQTIHNYLRQVADRYLRGADQERRRFMKTGAVPRQGRPGAGRSVDRLLVEADGVMLSLQRERMRKTEVKLGIAYEGWRRVGKNRYQTVNKTFVADTATAHEHWAGMLLKLHQQYDLGAVRDIVLGGDGATWVKEGADYLGARFQLSRYHLNRDLCRALGRQRQVFRTVWEACERGDVSTAVASLAAAGAATSGEQGRRIERVSRYIAENATGLGDYRSSLREPDSGLRRLGAMEGNVDKLVVRRMKNQGMNWTIKGIRRMLAIRLMYLEGSLQEWLHRETERPAPVAMATRLKRSIRRRLKQNHDDWLQVGLPALFGPHASRPWVIQLREMSRVPA